MERTRTDWPRVWFGVALGWLTAFNYFKVPPALPVLLDRFEFSPLVAGSFMSVFALAGLLLSTWIGRHIGRIGARRLATVALVITALGSLLGALLAGIPGIMLIARAVEALGYAVLSVVGVVLAVSAAAPRDKSLAAALWATWIPVGQVVASLVSIPALHAGVWQAAWYLGALACLLALMIATRMNGGHADSTSQIGAGDSPGKPASAALSIRVTVLPALLFALWSGQFVAFMTWLPEYLVDRHAVTPEQAALAYLVVPAMIIVFNLLAGLLLRRGVSSTGLLIIALMIQVALWLILPSISQTGVGLLSLAVYGASAGTVPTCMFNLPNALGLDPAGSARTFGFLMAGRNLGALAGPVLLPQIRGLSSGWDGVALVFTAVTLAAAGIGAAMFVAFHQGAKRPGSDTT